MGCARWWAPSADFASRTGRTVEVNIGEDYLKVTGVTSQQQEEIIDAWVIRQGRNEEAERLRRFGLNLDGSTAYH